MQLHEFNRAIIREVKLRAAPMLCLAEERGMSSLEQIIERSYDRVIADLQQRKEIFIKEIIKEL